MKWELGDNAVDGIRFVLVGAGSLLVLRLAYSGVLHALGGAEGDVLATVCTPFRSGYWTTDPYMVMGHTAGGVGSRLAMAMAVSMGVASALALAVYLLLRVQQGAAVRWAVGTMRTVLVVLVGWFLYAALMRPPAYTRFGTEALVLHQQASLFHELSLPWRSTETHHAWSQVRGFSTRTTTEGTEVVADITGHGEVLLTSGTAAEAKALVIELNMRNAAAGTD